MRLALVRVLWGLPLLYVLTKKIFCMSKKKIYNNFFDGFSFDGYSLDGCFLNGCFLDRCSLDSCSLGGCFLDGYSLNGCSLNGCFLDRCSLDGCLLWASQKMLVILLTLGKSKNNLTAKLDAWETLWATYPCHWHSTLASQAWEGLHQLWAQPRLLLVAFFSWLFRHPVFWFTSLFLIQSVRLPSVTYPSLCSAYVAYRTPCHASGHQALHTQPLPREAEDFPRGGNHSRHMPLLTCLAWLQPICYNL